MNVIITGAAGGLGTAIKNALMNKQFAPLGRTEPLAICCVDISGEKSVDAADPAGTEFQWPFTNNNPVDVIINCAGVNKQAWLHEATDDEWTETMDANAKSIWKMTQHFREQLILTRGTVLNIVSNAAHIPMRCSLAYNASKAAALMVTKQLARELSSDGVTVFSVSPNKLSGTGMSKAIESQVCAKRGWTPEQAAAYQRTTLLTGEETPPEQLAEFIAFLLSTKDRHKFLTGCDIPYGA